MFIIRLCNHANLQLVFAVFKAVLFCILKEGKATTHHGNYAVVFNLYLQGRKKTLLENYSCGILHAAEVHGRMMLPGARQRHLRTFIHTESSC